MYGSDAGQPIIFLVQCDCKYSRHIPTHQGSEKKTYNCDTVRRKTWQSKEITVMFGYLALLLLDCMLKHSFAYTV